MKYKGQSPCNSCPYRKDTELRFWDRIEFEKLLASERETIGAIYGCHKADETVCRGWLINQWNRNLPSIALRMSLAKNNVSRSYLEKLHSPAPLFQSVEDMCYANFPELKLHNMNKIILRGDWDSRTVWMNNELLSPQPSQQLRNHSPDGFNWGYAGSGPAQLALAVCHRALGEQKAREIYQDFKFKVIAGLPQRSFVAEIDMTGFKIISIR